MSYRFAGQLRIGGKLTADQLATLIDIVAMEGEGSLEYGDAIFEPKDKQDVIDALDEHTGHLILRNEQARYGQFEQTEAALTEAGIPWDRWSAAAYEYDAEMTWWHPGMDGPGETICDDDGNLLCLMKPVIEARKLLENVGVHAGARVDEALRLLINCTTDMPRLPKMEFV